MKTQKDIFLWLFLLSSLNVISNNVSQNRKMKIKFSGYVRYDISYDTRQTVNAREGIYLLYPEKPEWDKNQEDINATSNFNLSTINSFLKLDLTGPDILRAKSSAYFEFDFWGSESNKYIDLNHIRVRHAYTKFIWKNTELLFGQYWNPMTAPGFFPGVISSNCGVPFHPISRNPQIRVEQRIGLTKLIGSFYTQRDFTSTGPDGPNAKYLQNSGIPNMHFQVQFGTDSSTTIAGGGIDYKKIVPELHTSTESGLLKTGKESALSSLSFTGFMKIELDFLSVKLQSIYARNAYDIQLLGGYAVREITNDGKKKFSNLNTLSSWIDIQTIHKKFRYGLFGGYTKNMGAGKLIEETIYARGKDIKDVFRISPRIIYERLPFQASMEIEHTTANYGIINGDQKGNIIGAFPVANTRILFSTRYFF